MRNGMKASVAYATSHGSRRKSQATSGPTTSAPTTRAGKLPRARRGERGREQDRADSRVAEARDAVPARPREQQDGEADAGDRAAELRHPDHFARTWTAAVVVCPFSATTSL